MMKIAQLFVVFMMIAMAFAETEMETCTECTQVCEMKQNSLSECKKPNE